MYRVSIVCPFFGKFPAIVKLKNMAVSQTISTAGLLTNGATKEACTVIEKPSFPHTFTHFPLTLPVMFVIARTGQGNEHGNEQGSQEGAEAPGLASTARCKAMQFPCNVEGAKSKSGEGNWKTEKIPYEIQECKWPSLSLTRNTRDPKEEIIAFLKKKSGIDIDVGE